MLANSTTSSVADTLTMTLLSRLWKMFSPWTLVSFTKLSQVGCCGSSVGGMCPWSPLLLNAIDSMTTRGDRNSTVRATFSVHQAARGRLRRMSEIMEGSSIVIGVAQQQHLDGADYRQDHHQQHRQRGTVAELELDEGVAIDRIDRADGRVGRTTRGHDVELVEREQRAGHREDQHEGEGRTQQRHRHGQQP